MFFPTNNAFYSQIMIEITMKILFFNFLILDIDHKSFDNQIQRKKLKK